MPIYNTRIAPSIGGLSIGAYRLLSNGLPPSFYPEPLGAVMQKLTPFFPGCWTPNNFWAQCGMGDQVHAADGLGVWPPRGPAISMGAVAHTVGPMAAAVNPRTNSPVSGLLSTQPSKQPKSDPVWDLYNQLAARWPLISSGYENELCLFTVCATWGTSVCWGFGYTLVHSTQWPLWLEAEVQLYPGLSAIVPAEN